jgi:hypothetical protein
MFDLETMPKKWAQFTNEPWKTGNNDINLIKDNFPRVSLEFGGRKFTDELHLVRDWCQERFGDNWIYFWKDFYFIHEKDAVLFTLRWS